MKKTEKMECLRQATGTYKQCRCYPVFDPGYYMYYYILDYSDTLMLGIEEDDFQLDGFEICKISKLKEIVLRDDLCVRFNEEKRILDGVIKPEICLQSWKTVMESLLQRGGIVIVENEDDSGDRELFHIGIIKEIQKSSVHFLPFDADGVWFDAIDIPYSKITRVRFESRYAKRWQEYFENEGGIGKGCEPCTTN